MGQSVQQRKRADMYILSYTFFDKLKKNFFFFSLNDFIFNNMYREMISK